MPRRTITATSRRRSITTTRRAFRFASSRRAYSRGKRRALLTRRFSCGRRERSTAEPQRRVESHDPPLQSRKPFLEPPLFGPITLGDRIGEGERQRIAVIRRGKATPAHVVLALQQDGVGGVVAV